MTSEIFAPPVAAQTRGPFLSLRGGFDFGSAKVPFWAVTLRAEDAVNYIRLPSDIPISDSRPIDINELFQRELDESRVQGELRAYIKSADEPRFFNSLTVALLPLIKEKDDGHLHLADSYAVTGRFAHPPVAGYALNDIGQIATYDHPTDPGHGFIAWDPSSTMPVVLDGQHRLATLKDALSGAAFPGKADLAGSRISILFLVLDARAGFTNGPGSSVLSACRSVFIDLNKHAKSVSKARQYLLDDRDVTASALRAVLDDTVEANPEGSVAERVGTSARLPLALVDWRSDSAKFDGESPYLTTILALHGVIEAIVAAKAPNSDEYEELRGYCQRIVARLLPSDEAPAVQEELLTALEVASVMERPFSLPLNVVKRLAEGFRAKYGARIVRPLTEIAPYRAIIGKFESSGWLSTRVEPWFSLDPVGASRLIEGLEMADPGPSVHAASRSLKADNLAFQVVFQRGLLLALHSILAFPGEIWTEGFGLEGVGDPDRLISEYIKRADERLVPSLEAGARADSPFVGAGVRSDGTIDFRKTRIAGIVGVMTLAVMAPRGASRDELANWLSDNWTRQNGAVTPVQQLLASHGSAWRRGLADVLRARGVDVEETTILSLAADQLSRLVP